MSDWKEYSIEDVAEILSSGGDAAKYPCKKSPEDGFGIPVYANSLENEGLYGYTNVAEINDDAVCIAARGAGTGHVYYHKGPFVPIVRLITLVPKREIADTRFLYYYLSGKKISGDGSAIPQITLPMVKKMEISLPSLSIQKWISSILSTLDYKIECNRRINENLEQQAQALFKSWFVDFEPFKDQPFVESELGMIPQGWKVVELGDLVEIIDNRGKTPPLESKDLYPIIDVKALTGLGRVLDYNKCSKYVNHETYTSWFRSGHPKKYDILLSTVGSLAETKLFMGGNGCIAQNVVALRNIDYSLYLYDYLNRIKSDLVAYNIGSVQPSIKITHIVKHKIIVPQAKVLEKYQILSRKLTESICNYCSEIDNLSSLRDELLPKLMSGEIEIN